MDNSTYIKAVLKSNKTIALAADKGGAAFQREFKKSINNIALGAERVSWISACFLNEYQDECRALEWEDMRMGKCIFEFFARKDPVADLILICLKYILGFYNEKERVMILAMVYNVYESYKVNARDSDDSLVYENNIYYINKCDDFYELPSDSTEKQKLLEGIAYVCNFSSWDLISEPLLATDGLFNPARIATDLVARKTVAYTFAKAAAESISLTLSARSKLNNRMGWLAFGLSYYGIVQKAAISARRLKMLNPDYYQMLYKNDLEMFFFLIESYLPPEIYHPSLFVGDKDVAVHFLRSLLK